VARESGRAAACWRRRVAATDSHGAAVRESGTGKEVLARYIHRHSAASECAFVAINCARSPRTCWKRCSSVTRRAAFTAPTPPCPASSSSRGRHAAARRDLRDGRRACRPSCCACCRSARWSVWVDDAPLALERQGHRHHDRELRAQVASGRFREDLYYRISVFPLRCCRCASVARILPLAERLVRRHAGERCTRADPVRRRRAARLLSAPVARPTCASWTTRMAARADMQGGSVVSAAHLRLERWHRRQRAAEPGPGDAAGAGGVARGLPMIRTERRSAHCAEFEIKS